MPTREKTLHRLRVPDEVAVLIRHLHPEIRRKVKFALKEILSDPHAGKMLKDDLKGLLSYRVEPHLPPDVLGIYLYLPVI